MQKILLLVIVITLLATNSISGQTKELEESTKQWVFLSEGNPIDGVKRTAFRINNEQNEGQNLFILKIESSAELVKIENSTGEGKNDRDNILVNIRSSESFENLDEILMYFDNEKIFYKVNFRKYSNNGLIWWNAVSSDDEEFISMFNLINKLKSKSKVYFRFKYLDGEQINASFTLNGSTSTINRVFNLPNLDKNDFYMDVIAGVASQTTFAISEEVNKGLGIYLDGQLDSLIRVYLNSKVSQYHLAFIRNYEFDDGGIKAYDLNDKLVAIIPFNYFNKSNSKKDGLRKLWYEKGQLKIEGNYKDGKKFGLYKEWYENGQLDVECNFKNDELDGYFQKWYKNGQLEKEYNYKNGKKDGLQRDWYENGQLMSFFSYIDGKKDGLRKSWYENGKLRGEVNYKDGVLVK